MTNERVTANGFRPDATGFQVPSKHLIIGGTLFGVGCARAAYAAGSRAWQDENTTQPANAES